MPFENVRASGQILMRLPWGVPLRGSGIVTVVDTLTSKGLEAVMELDGALNEAAFTAYLDQALGPTLRP